MIEESSSSPKCHSMTGFAIVVARKAGAATENFTYLLYLKEMEHMYFPDNNFLYKFSYYGKIPEHN